MQKVISALEHLESLSATRDQEKETIENLRTTISHLEIEDTKKNEEKHRNAKVSNWVLHNSYNFLMLHDMRLFKGLKSLKLTLMELC